MRVAVVAIAALAALALPAAPVFPDAEGHSATAAEADRRTLAASINARAWAGLGTSSAGEQGDHLLLRARLRIVEETVGDPRLRDDLFAEFLRWQITDIGVRGLERLYESYRERTTLKRFPQDLEDLWAAERARLASVDRIAVYKTADGQPLEAYLFNPPGDAAGRPRPAIAFFHGGGWTMGRAAWGFARARYFARRGMVALSVQYRLKERHGTTPIEAMADTKSLFRWLRTHAVELGIDPHRIVGAGWSAGGHLVTSAAVIEGFDEEGEDLAVSSRPNALVLWYPAISVGGDDWFAVQVAGRATAANCSPTQAVGPGAPPTIIFQGSDDRVVRLAQVSEFDRRMRAAGNRSELVVYQGRHHVFTSDPEDYVDTIRRADEFLASLGYLEGPPDPELIRALISPVPRDPERWGL